MNRRFDLYLTQQAIDLLMKLAGVAVTSVATVSVARSAFSYLSEPWLSFVTFGALILIEGAFIASWLAIDTQRNAPMALKVAWSVTLITVYVALLIVALAHGEGSAGWAFRFVMAVMIGRSIYEAGVYEVLKSNHRADHDIRNAYVIRRLKRRHARDSAIKTLHVNSDESNYSRELKNVVERARIDAEHEAAMVDTQLYRALLIERIHAKDRLARGQLQARLAPGRKEIAKEIAAAEES